MLPSTGGKWATWVLDTPMRFAEWMILQEGLIPVPQKMLKEAMDQIVQEMVTYIDKKVMRGKKRKYPEHNQQLKTVCQRFGVKPAERWFNRFWEVKYDVSDLPQPIRDVFTHEKPVLRILFDYKNHLFPEGDGLSEKQAFYVDSVRGEPKEIIAVNTSFMKRFLIQDPSDIWYFIARLRENIQHEMTHMIQWRALNKLDPSYDKEKGIDYHKGGKDYFTDVREFDPQIKSAVAEFQHTMRTQQWLQRTGSKPMGGFKSEREAIDVFVGTRSLGMGHLWQTDSFFKNLKRHDPQMWRLAVKKFVAALHDDRYDFYAGLD